VQNLNDPKIIVALDFPSQNPALALADQLDPAKCRLKVGKELFTRSGPDLVKALQSRGFDIFLDLKFHDIPNTTSAAVAAAAELGVWMVNVHASGGEKMMVGPCWYRYSKFGRSPCFPSGNPDQKQRPGWRRLLRSGSPASESGAGQ